MSLKFTDILANLGDWCGIGPGDVSDGVWSDPMNQRRANNCLRGGLDQVGKPPILPGEASAYSWGWLHPVGSVVILTNTNTAPMPDDFAGIEGDIFIADAGQNAYEPVSVKNIQFVLAKNAQFPTNTGPPLEIGIDAVKGEGLTSGQRYQMSVYPIADQVYTLSFQYYFLENVLNGTNPFPPGGAWLAETINVSVKAYWEAHYDNIMGGPMQAMFMQSLAASIAADRKSKPQAGGYNGDTSDLMFNRGRLLREQATAVYVGVGNP